MWQVRQRMTNVPSHQLRLVSYELDHMVGLSSFVWRLYTHVDVDHLPDILTRWLWAAKCPLICDEIVEWCYSDRVTRKFDFRQVIPFSSHDPYHTRLHESYLDASDWSSILQQYIQLWTDRGRGIITPHDYIPDELESCRDAYMHWYDRLIRRIILNPTEWRGQHGFSGTNLRS